MRACAKFGFFLLITLIIFPSVSGFVRMGASLEGLRLFSGFGQVHPIQSIYDSLRRINNPEEVALNPSSSAELDMVRSRMSDISLEDLGLNENIDRIDRPYCMTVASEPGFTLAVFMVPRGQSLPLHDHPGMLVLSKLVHGALDVTSYSRLPSNEKVEEVARDGFVCHMVETDVRHETSCPPWMLTPTSRNLHTFTCPASQPHAAVILDVLLPPYRPGLRDCTYYECAPVETMSKGGEYVRMVPCEPSDPLPEGVCYEGIVPQSLSSLR